MSRIRRQYPFHLIEPQWQSHWEAQETFRAFNPGERPAEGHPFAVRHGDVPPELMAQFLPEICGGLNPDELSFMLGG